MRNYRLYFTEQAIKSFKQIDDTNDYQRLVNYLNHNLCLYPLQGKLLLNYSSNDSDITHLILEIANQFNQDIREVCYGNYLILYLIEQQQIYLLDFISLKHTDPALVAHWHRN